MRYHYTLTFLLLFICLATTAQSPNPGLVSINRTGTGTGNGQSYFSVTSADGRIVAFASEATDLVNVTDTNNEPDVFVRDMSTGQTRLVSVNVTGTRTGNRGSTGPSLSADGRYVAFYSGASDLAAGDSGLTQDVFVRDLVAGTTTLVSVNSAGNGSGNNNSLSPVISADGRIVVFASVASNLSSTPDTNNFVDIYARNLQTRTTRLLSANQAGNNSGNLESGSLSGGGVVTPVISANGRWVFFLSHATNLVSISDANSTTDLFGYDLQTNTLSLISVNRDNTATGNGTTNMGVCSADGRFVAFPSNSRNLTAIDAEGLYVRDLQQGTTILASINRNGTSSQVAFSPSISADGQFVAFSTTSNDLTSLPHALGLNVFVRDLQKGITSLVSVNRLGNGAGNSESNRLVISANGRFVAFNSLADDLTFISDQQNTEDTFVRDLQTGVTYPASINRTGTALSGGGSSFPTTISNDGRIVVFTSLASDLTANDGNSLYDLFAYSVPQRAPLGNASAASFKPTSLAPGSIAAAFGSNLASITQIAATLPLPTTLAGTTVKFTDSTGIERLAPLFFVSSGQVNYQVPSDTALGTARVEISNETGTISIGLVTIERVSPGLFSANADGQGPAAAVILRIKADGSQTYEPVAQFDQAQQKFVTAPIDMRQETDQIFLLLFGTGISNISSLTGVSAKLAHFDTPVLYAGSQGGYAGLDQINLPISRNLVGYGEIDVSVTVDGKTSNLVKISLR